MRGLLVLLAALAFADGVHASQRVFVASNGSDANSGCLFISPCRTFAVALEQVDAGGEIVALDAAGYGPVTITKSVTITTNSGYYAGIAASTGTAISIPVADIDVVLRGLDLRGFGATTGVQMTQTARLTIENCIVSGFTHHGIEITGFNALVWIVNTIVRANGDNGGAGGSFSGIFISGAMASLNNVSMSHNARAGLEVREAVPTGTTTVSVANSSSSFSTYGYLAVNAGSSGSANLVVVQSSAAKNAIAGVQAGSTGTHVSVGKSQVVGNTKGLVNVGGVFVTYGDNAVESNGTNIEGTMSSQAGQ